LPQARIRERERRVEHAGRDERVEDFGGRRSVGPGRVGGDRIGDGSGIPQGEIGAAAVGCCREPVMLHGHVREQVSQGPAGARCRLGQIVRRDGADDVDGLQHGGPMKGQNVGINLHM
jgi:hypothetical protein